MYVLFTEEEYFNEEKKLLRIDGCCHVDNFRGGWQADAANSTSSVMDEVIVWGNKNHGVSIGEMPQDLAGGYISDGANLGYLGVTNTLKTPFTQVSFTEKTIQDYGDPSQPINGVIINMPSVRTSGCTMYNDFSVRGLNINGYQMYLNGVPGMFKQANTPSNFIERVEVAAGPNQGITGTTASESAGGIVNLVSKRAGAEDITNASFTFSGKNLFGEHIDVSRRFGQNKEWGIRVNAENISGETSINNEKLTNRDVSVNIDRKTDNSYTNLFMGYFYSKQENGQRWFGFSGNDFKTLKSVLKAPDASKNLSFDGQVFEYDDWAVTLNHEQKMTDNWKFFVNAGYNRYDLFNNVNSKSSKYFIINKNGEFKADNWVQNFPITGYYGQLGFKGIEYTGKVKHNLVVSVDKNWYDSYRCLDKTDQNNQQFQTANGNIYTGVPHGAFVNYNADKIRWGALGSTSRRWSWAVNDNIEYGKLNVLLGYVSNHSKTFTYNKNEEVTDVKSSTGQSPTYGLVYSPNDDLSFYASHSESFNMESLVPNGKGYENTGAILPAAKTKQNEIGIKYLKNDLLTTLSYFDIKKAGNVPVVENGKTYLRQDGEDEYKGVEFAVNGKLSPKWNIMGGIMYLDAEHHKTDKKLLDNTRISGAAKWNAVVALEYAANDKLAAFGRILYNGSSEIWNKEVTNQLRVPSYTTFDLGIKYQTMLSHTPVTLGLTCYNVFDRNYWIAKSGVDTVILSNPRTFVLSAKFAL